MDAEEYEGSSDERLMALSAEGDRDAFNVLAGRHLARALRTAMRIVGNASDAEEIAQEALLRIWIHARRWKPQRSKLSTWLYQIVVNLCLDRRRRQVAAEGVAEAAELSDTPGDEVEALQRRAAVARAIEELPVRQRAALTLSCYEELSGAEIAAALSTSLKAVESLLLRSRRFLKERLRSSDV